MSTVVLDNRSPSGEIRAIGSKTEAHLALVCSMLCASPTKLMNLPSALDVCSTANCLEAMGCTLSETEDTACVEPGQYSSRPLLSCGESGTALYLLLPVLAGLPDCSPTFTGRGRLPDRPLKPLLEALAQNGVQADADRLPLRISGTAKTGIYHLPGGELSAPAAGFLLMLGMTGGELRLISPLESPGIILMTRSVMQTFGVHAEGLAVHRQRYRSPGRYEIEGDWATASVWLAAGALGNGITVSGLNPDSLQPERAICEIMARMQVPVELKNSSATVKPGKLQGTEIDCTAVPDIAPALMALGAAAEGTTLLTGLGGLRDREGNRLEAATAAMRSIGVDFENGPDWVRIYGKPKFRGGETDCGGDHRVAMALAILAQRCEQPVILHGAGCVEKSYPEFFEDWDSLCGQ